MSLFSLIMIQRIISDIVRRTTTSQIMIRRIISHTVRRTTTSQTATALALHEGNAADFQLNKIVLKILPYENQTYG